MTGGQIARIGSVATLIIIALWMFIFQLTPVGFVPLILAIIILVVFKHDGGSSGGHGHGGH